MWTKTHDEKNDSYSKSAQDTGEDAVPRKSKTVCDPNTSTPALPRRWSTSDIDTKTFPQVSARRCASQENTPTKTVQFHRICCRSKSESYTSHKPDSLRGGVTDSPCPTEVSRPIMIWQREEREEMKRKAQREREQAARVTKSGLDRNVLANREQNSLEHDLQSVSYPVISSEHMSLGNIDLDASQSENTDSFHLTEGDASEVKDEVRENLTFGDGSLNRESEDDQKNGESVQTSNIETCSDISEGIVSPNSEIVSNPKTSTPTSKNILPPFISFIKCCIESQPQRWSTSGIDTKTFSQVSARRCVSQDSTPTKTVQFHRIRCRSKSESYTSHEPDSLCGGVTDSPCPTEVSRPIMIWQREEREEMKRKAQREREQAARVTKLGLDRNVLAHREQNSLEHDLQSVSYPLISPEHMSLENIEVYLDAPNTEATLEILQSENSDSFHLTEDNVSDIKVSGSLSSYDVSLNSEREDEQQNEEDVLTELQYSL